VDGNHLGCRESAANLGYVLFGHGNWAAAGDITCGSGVEDDHVRRKLLKSLLHFRAPDGIARNIERWLARSQDDEAGDGTHLSPQFARSMLATGTVYPQPVPFQVLRYRHDLRKSGLFDDSLIWWLAQNGQVLWQQSLCACIPMIAMSMRHHHRVNMLKQLFKLSLREWQFNHRDTPLVARIGNGVHRLRLAEHRINKDAQVVYGNHKGGVSQKMDLHSRPLSEEKIF